MRIPTYRTDSVDEKAFARDVRKNVHAYFTERGLSTKGDLGLAIKVVVMLTLYVSPLVLLIALQLTGWWAVLSAVVMFLKA